MLQIPPAPLHRTRTPSLSLLSHSSSPSLSLVAKWESLPRTTVPTTFTENNILLQLQVKGARNKPCWTTKAPTCHGRQASMRSKALAAVALTGSAGLSSFAAGASVEAGTLTTVTAEAPLYDTNLSETNGCDPAGCAASLTRVSGTALPQLTLRRPLFVLCGTLRFLA